MIITWVVGLLECCIAISLHSLGLFVLFQYRKRTNQNIILIFISIAEILTTICIIIKDIPNLQQDVPLWFNIGQSASVCGLCEFLFMMFILTIDRLICVVNPLKYHIRMSKTILKYLVILSWCLSLAVSLIYGLIPLHKKCIQISASGFVAVYIILVICTYVKIFKSVKHSRRSYRRKNLNSRSEVRTIHRMKKEYLVPILIIATYIGLYAIPYPIFRLLPMDAKTLEEEKANVLRSRICELILWSGFIVDPIVYIFLTKHYRKIILQKCCCCLGRDRHAQPSITTVTLKRYVTHTLSH